MAEADRELCVVTVEAEQLFEAGSQRSNLDGLVDERRADVESGRSEREALVGAAGFDPGWLVVMFGDDHGDTRRTQDVRCVASGL